jgi:hypothetical protein
MEPLVKCEIMANVEGHTKSWQMSADNGSGNYSYTTDIVLTSSGEYGYQFRILPSHPLLTDKFELRLVKWVE